MSKIREYNGNNYSNSIVDYYNIDETDMENIIFFIRKYDEIYLYGNGQCGSGMKEYFDICGFHNIKGFVTSDTLQEFAKGYKRQKCGIILALKSDYYSEILPGLLKLVDVEDVLFLKERSKLVFMNTFSREYLSRNFWINLPIAKHCNINCASCNMFSPLCAREFYTLESVRKDMEKIKKIGIPLTHINITGGEPFLNPEILDILMFIRDMFPETRIDVYTNALLMANYGDQEFEKLGKCDLIFYITEYGIDMDGLSAVYQRMDEFHIKYESNYTDGTKEFYKKTIDFEHAVPKYEYINCLYYTFCRAVFVFEGKIYKCPMAMNREYINRVSEKKIEMSNKDYLVLADVNSSEEIYDFWRSRLPMCSYCPRTTEIVTWHRSERKIEEWT